MITKPEFRLWCAALALPLMTLAGCSHSLESIEPEAIPMRPMTLQERAPIRGVPGELDEATRGIPLAEAPVVDSFTTSPPSSANANDVFYGGVSLGGVSKSARRYHPLVENPWQDPFAEPLSTFSIDVDTASFSHVRSLVESGHGHKNIHKDAVRIEEWINWFEWDYPQPRGGHPFSISTEVASCPWREEHQLVKIGIQGMFVPEAIQPPANLVFLVDISGSMAGPAKLGLVKKGLSLLAEDMTEKDRVAIVVYAGEEGVALESTPGSERGLIQKTITNLEAGGSTNGGAGIKLAYKIATENYIENGINRVVLCTDGDFNVGMTGTGQLGDLISEKAEDHIFLTIAGFGTDNLNDHMLEAVSNRGNGNYYFIDSAKEAEKVFRSELPGMLMAIAKDVKIQVEFNPANVASYRLIGYCDRILDAKDFDNDTIDAGEIGAGHSVTAIYEVIPPGVKPDLRYQKSGKRRIDPVDVGEIAWLKLRYKNPDGEKSKLVEQAVLKSKTLFEESSNDFQFASAVALLGLKLRGHESVENQTFKDVVDLITLAAGEDPDRKQLVDLATKLESQDNGCRPGEIFISTGISF